jgi:hypothetical protein
MQARVATSSNLRLVHVRISGGQFFFLVGAGLNVRSMLFFLVGKFESQVDAFSSWSAGLNLNSMPFFPGWHIFLLVGEVIYIVYSLDISYI